MVKQMTEISATIRLRPTRIGFLVNPTDLKSVRKIMQINTCLWGGRYNPIIPVYKTPPKEWRAARHEYIKGLGIARGYISFFEPDVFVEAKHGLLEEAGLRALRDTHSTDPYISLLNKFLETHYNTDWSEPTVGLNIIDVFNHVYETEQRFEQRDKIPAILVKPERGSGLAEAIFGIYPRQKDASYIANGYRDLFLPKEMKANPEAWLEAFRNSARTPLRVTGYRLDFQRYWHHDPIIYVFDPTRPTDLIDLWNLRLEPHPILPVPIEWIGDLSDFLRSVIEKQHRPVRGNPNGIMHHCTIEIGRSITKEQGENIVKTLTRGLPNGSVALKTWRNRIWEPKSDGHGPRHEKLDINYDEKHATLTVKEENNQLTARFQALSPDFARKYGGHRMRWVNAVQIRAYGPNNVATVLPYNTFDRRWPGLGLGGEWTTVSSEGWIFAQQFKKFDEYLHLLKKEEAVIGTLKRFGVEAALSDPGHIAKQVLDHIGGLWGVRFLADREVVQLLNKMAGSVRRRENQEGSLEEHFEGRSAPVKDWADLIAKNASKSIFRTTTLNDYTSRHIIKIGLQTTCPHCHGNNWHALDVVDYRPQCERCLNNYDFPQATDEGRKWKYRVVGPFSIPDYARGSYSALLTLRALDSIRGGGRGEMTFSTALDMSFDGIKCEADFVALRRNEKMDEDLPPELIIGESKSLGNGDLIKRKDLTKLRHIAKKLPGAVIVISVMREKFTATELAILKPFVEWGRRRDENGRATNPVILFTGHELFVDYTLGGKWKDLGKPHKDYADFDHTKDLYSLAQATQAIHLKLPTFHQGWISKLDARRARAIPKAAS